MQLAAVALALTVTTTVSAKPHAPELRPGGRPIATSRRATTDLGPGWHASAGWLTGGTLPAFGAVADPAIAATAARALVLAQLAPGTTAADWELVANRVDAGLRTVAFRQRWRGIAVLDGQVSCVFGRDRLFAIGTNILPIPTGDPAAPAADPAKAIEWLGGELGPLAVLGVRDRVVFDGQLADVVALDGPATRWTLFVGLDGAPIAARDELHHDGTLLYDAPIRWPGDARMAYPAATVDVTVDGLAQTSSVAGMLTWVTDSPATVVPSVTGPFAKVTSAVAAATGSLPLAIGGTTTWSRATVPTEDAELAAYIHVMRGKARIRPIVPALATWLDQQISVTVDEPGACNAYSTGDDLHFFIGSPACENTGRLADVVYHELGHSIHNQTIIAGQGQFNTYLSEGLADFNATTNLDDSGIGRGFDFTNTPLRELDPPGRDLRWPEDASDDAHVSGIIMAGALWDLRKLAGEPVAEIAFRGAMERGIDLPTSYTAALIDDDDDANLGNGTPHGCAIGEAFARHGIAGDFATTKVGLPTVTGLTISVPIAIPVNPDCPAPTVTSATIHWSSAIAADAVAMTTTDGVTYTGTIPDRAGDDVIQYSIDVALANGMSVQLPSTLADPLYEIVPREETVIYCATMDEDPGWTHTAGWQFGPPTANGADPSAAFTGANVFGTNLHANGDYTNNAHELATSPRIDVRAFVDVHLQYRRWLTVEDGAYDQATVAVNGTTVWTNAQHNGTLNHFDREWRFQSFPIDSMITDGSVTLSFGLATDSQGISGGWNLDDVCVVGMKTFCIDGCGPPDAGCCGTSHPTGDLVLGLGVVAIAARRRRR